MSDVHPAYRIEGPALISFSGGRTSAYMLHEILRAHDGKLPDDVVVAFANTGKEREETLRFVHECGSRWGVPIHWLEWRNNDAGFEEVGLNSASRDGEPFRALIRERQYLPNAVARFCSVVLKVRTAAAFARSLGWTHWANVIGLRHDEGRRVLKALARNESNKEPFKASMPLSKAKVAKRDVMSFWLGPTMRLESGVRPQGFDLGLRDHEGNCDVCFLKSLNKKMACERDAPGATDWWVNEEAWVTDNTTPTHRIERMLADADPAQRAWIEEMAAKGAVVHAGARFVTEYAMSDVARWTREQPLLITDDLLSDEHDAECGLWCAGEAA